MYFKQAEITRFVLEVNLELSVRQDDDLPNVLDSMAVSLVVLEAVLVLEVSEAASAPVQCVRLHSISHERWE